MGGVDCDGALLGVRVCEGDSVGVWVAKGDVLVEEDADG